MATVMAHEKEYVHTLCVLTLDPVHADTAFDLVNDLSGDERAEFVALADSHHVVIRALSTVSRVAGETGHSRLMEWAEGQIEEQRRRIGNALRYLDRVCHELEDGGCPVVVIKSLDHDPDLGNDLDLYSSGDPRRVVRIMVNKFDAQLEPRSWGDRLANKWNFAIPGLRESVEIHVQRLGQTGEHTRLARRFVERRVPRQIGGYTFPVPAPEERIVVATLQRMYRHFYFRVCDVVNSAQLVESGEIDYAQLRKASAEAGIWPGVAAYLAIVSDYVARYRGRGLELPPMVREAASFGGNKVQVKGKFLRVPIFPDGAKLYTKQMASTAFRGDVPAAFRLSLLPPLASAAAIAFRITGSDKGVW